MTIALLKKEGISLIRDGYKILFNSNVKKSYENELCFPPCLFIPQKGSQLCTSEQGLWGITSFNPVHSFSIWLFSVCKKLQKDARGTYDRIISSMIRSGSPHELIQSLNNEIEMLKKISGDPFSAISLKEIDENDFNGSLFI